MSDVDHLTDIFMDVSEGAESTTEQQEEQRGSWQPTTAGSTDASIREIVVEMRDRYGLQTKLSDEQLVTLVTSYFDGETDTEIAREIDNDSLNKTVRRARLKLHLFRESDTEADFDVEALKECLEAGNSGADCGQQIGISKSTANSYRRIFDTKAEAKRVGYQYFERFEQCCHSKDETVDPTPQPVGNNGLADAVDGAGADNPQLQ